LKIKVFPSKELHKIWKQWLAGYRFVYNWCIATLKKDKSLSGFTLQKMVREAKDIPDWVNQIPGHQKQEACVEARDAFTQAKANKGEAKFKSCKATRQTIAFKVGNYKNGTWYTKLTKGLAFKASQPIPFNCEYGTKLVYSRGNWFACFPTVKEEMATESSKVIALDPGNRSFLTGYDGESLLDVGKNDIGRINRLCSHLDQLISKMTTSPHKRQRRQMRKASYRLREKINNLVKDLHNKVSHYLTSNYKVIFLPTFETSQMVLKSKRKIKRKSARNMLTWSHYQFAQHLIQTAERKNVLVIRLSEAYTSKTCGNCGHIHKKLGGSKVFKCPNCQTNILRDVNGARNIMLRALQAVAFTVTSDVVLNLESSN
jgi:putative transposase